MVSHTVCFLRRSSIHDDTAVLLLSFVLLLWQTANSQTFQSLPELDFHTKLSSNLRFDFQAKETREAGDPTQAEIGPSLSFFLKPLIRLKYVTVFDLDDSKSRPLQFVVGFRYVGSPDKPTVWRVVLAAIPRLRLPVKILLTDRNRADLDSTSDQFTWRYRNRLTLERRIGIRSFHPAPYLSAEAFYQSQYHKWSTTAIYVGCLLPVRKHFELDPYFVHQKITGKSPNQQLKQFGLTLNLYF